MRPNENGGLASVLCPCWFGAKSNEEDGNETDREVNDNQTSPFVGKTTRVDGSSSVPSGTGGVGGGSEKITCDIRKISARKTNRDDLSLPPATHRSKPPDGTSADQEEITFEFERQSNASSMHQIPSLHTEADLGPGRGGGGGGTGSRARSVASRHSVDDDRSYRSVLKIDRTPSLSYCSEGGVAKSSSVLVNIPSSRGSLSSFGRWYSKRSPSPDGMRRGCSPTPSNLTDANLTSSRHHINRMDIHNSSTPAISTSCSSRNVNLLQERKAT